MSESQSGLLRKEESMSDVDSDASPDDMAEGVREPRSQSMMEKDSDEEELERLVLGDTRNFREQLFRGDEPLPAGEDPDLDRSEELGAKPASTGFEDIDDAELFAFDVGTRVGHGQLVAAPGPKSGVAREEEARNAPAWEDSDDERLRISLAGASQLRKLRISEAEDAVSGTEYTRRLRQQYLKLNPFPAWARYAEERPKKRRRRSSIDSESASEAPASDEEPGDSALPLDDFLRNAAALKGARSGKTRKLRPEVIDIQRSRDVPDTHRDAVTSLSFHPKYPVLLSSSTSSILFLHHMAPTAHPTPNPRLTSVQAKQVPVRRAEFLRPDGDMIFFAGRRRFIHSWDLPSGIVQKTQRIQSHHLEQRTWERFRLSPCGRWMGLIASTRKGGGIINILNVNTMQWITAARLDSRGGIVDFSWWGDGNGLTILGKGGEVGEWSMTTRRFLGIWNDEGSNGATVVTLGGGGGPAVLGGDRWVAVGANSGVVNVYDRCSLMASSASDDEPVVKARPQPNRAFMQLTTPVTFLVFSPDAQLLAVGSVHKKDALRLAHLPSCTIYRNWPTDQTPLGRITAVAFGRKSDILAVGNDSGKIRLWEIRS